MNKQIKELEKVNYQILPANEVSEYIQNMAKEEWGPEDFELYGDDLNKSEWKLEEIELDKITMRADLLASEEFMKDVEPRIENQLKIIPAGIAIPPLVLRGSDLLIFDGYARTNALKKLGKNKCFAYVGHRT
jgi:hypothetical protein